MKKIGIITFHRANNYGAIFQTYALKFVLQNLGSQADVINYSCKQIENLTKFSIKDNGFKCDTCCKTDKGAIDMNETTTDAIRYIILADAKKIYSFNIPNESIEELKIISKISDSILSMFVFIIRHIKNKINKGKMMR